MAEKPFNVLIRDGRWVVVRNGETETISAHDRKQDAVRAARALARQAAAPLYVFTLDGRPDPRYYE